MMKRKELPFRLKQLEGHPGEKLDEKLQVGDKVRKVVVVADYKVC